MYYVYFTYVGSYEKARNIARKAEETSNLDSDDEIMQQRSRHPPTRFSDSGSDAGKFQTKYCFSLLKLVQFSRFAVIVAVTVYILVCKLDLKYFCNHSLPQKYG